MSLIYTSQVECPACGAISSREVASSVAADRRPDLRAAIIDDSFQRFACDHCGAASRLSPTLTYMDVSRSLWILTLPAEKRAYWESLEAGARSIFDDSFGASAPAAAKALAKRLAARVTFGWPALREKLLCQDYGIDDVDLETLKLLLMRTVEAPNVSDTAALRLVGRSTSGSLLLSWIRDADDSQGEILEIPANLIEEIRGAAWSEARQQLGSFPFVDVTRLLVEPELPVAAE